MPKLKYEELSTVNSLIAELEAIKAEHGNVVFGVIGHFGEVHNFTFKDGYYHMNHVYQVPTNATWRSEARKELPSVFDVSGCVPDLGPEPD